MAQESDTIEKAARLLAVSYCAHDREGWYDAAQEMSRTVISQAAEIARLTAALERIERWFGEFPETGEFWDEEKTRPMSYGAQWGSNGERDYMRAVARAALSHPRLGDSDQ